MGGGFFFVSLYDRERLGWLDYLECHGMRRGDADLGGPLRLIGDG